MLTPDEINSGAYKLAVLREQCEGVRKPYKDAIKEYLEADAAITNARMVTGEMSNRMKK